jgi:predicted deacylase
MNVLQSLDMLEVSVERPDYQYRINKSTWIRAEMGGLLRFHVAPGEVVDTAQPIATNFSVYGAERNVLRATVSGVVLGMTTLPLVKPGEPVCCLATIDGSIEDVRSAQRNQSRQSLGRRLREQLAASISVAER